MPLFALGLNLAWEWIYGLDGLFGSQSFIMAQSVANIAWALCDVAVLATWLKFGRQYLPERAKPYFGAYTAMAIGFGFALQMAFYIGSPTPEDGSIYSAYAQNAAMSAMFLVQLFLRDDTKAQSVPIAVLEMAGTLAPTIYGQLGTTHLAPYILICGAVSFVLDVAYIVLLAKRKREEAA